MPPKERPATGYCSRCQERKETLWRDCEYTARRSVCIRCDELGVRPRMRTRTRIEIVVPSVPKPDPQIGDRETRIDYGGDSLQPIPKLNVPPLSRRASNHSTTNPSDLVLKAGPRLAQLQPAARPSQLTTNSQPARSATTSTMAAVSEAGQVDSPIVLGDSDDEPLCEVQGRNNQSGGRARQPQNMHRIDQTNDQQQAHPTDTSEEGQEIQAHPQDNRQGPHPAVNQPTAIHNNPYMRTANELEADREEAEENELLLAGADRIIKRRQQKLDFVVELRAALARQIDRTTSAKAENLQLRARFQQQHNELQRLQNLLKPLDDRNQRSLKRVRELEVENNGQQKQIEHLEKRVRRLKEGAEMISEHFERMNQED